MFIETFKRSEPAPHLERDLIEVIQVAYNKRIAELAQPELKEFCNLRSKIENLNKRFDSLNTEDLPTNLIIVKADLIRYLNHVNKLCKKFVLLNSYEKRNLFVRFENYFSYFDIFSGNSYKEGMLNESLWALYNLAIVYFRLGVHMKVQIFEMINHKDEAIKEAMKNFQMAVAGFEMLLQNIKYYSPALLETMNDFHSVLINSSISYCKAEIQSMVFHLAESKKMDFELQSSLAKNASDLFSELASYIEIEPYSNTKRLHEEIKIKSKYYSSLYLSLAYDSLAKFSESSFKETGINYGNTITYLKEAITVLEITTPLMKNAIFSRSMNYKQYASIVLIKLKKCIELKVIENQKIYNQPIKEIKYLPQLTTLNKVKSIEFSDDIEEAIPNLFTCLEPIKHIERFEIYKSKFSQNIKHKLDLICSNGEIEKFQNEIIETSVGEFKYLVKNSFSQSQIIEPGSDLFLKIKKLQEKGGSNFIISSIKNMNGNYASIIKTLTYLREKLTQEEKLDSHNRSKFNDNEKAARLKLDYTKIIPSNQANKHLFAAIAKLESVINKGNQVDLEIIKKMEALLVDPQVNLNSSLTSAYNSCISFLTINKIDAINEMIKTVSNVEEKKSEEERIFNEIPEWCILNDTILTFQKLIESITILKDKLLEKVNDLSDIDLSDFSSGCDINEMVERKTIEICNSHMFLAAINQLEEMNMSINKLKEIIMSNSRILQEKISNLKKESSIEGGNLVGMSTKLFEPESIPMFYFFQNLELALDKYFELNANVKHSNSFYDQQNEKAKLLHTQIVKYLIERQIRVDHFVYIFNSNGVKANNYRTSEASNKLVDELKALENLTISSHLNPCTNQITNLKMGK